MLETVLNVKIIDELEIRQVDVTKIIGPSTLGAEAHFAEESINNTGIKDPGITMEREVSQIVEAVKVEVHFTELNFEVAKEIIVKAKRTKTKMIYLLIT